MRTITIDYIIRRATIVIYRRSGKNYEEISIPDFLWNAPETPLWQQGLSISNTERRNSISKTLINLPVD